MNFGLRLALSRIALFVRHCGEGLRKLEIVVASAVGRKSVRHARRATSELARRRFAPLALAVPTQ
jgi:hypothetical protein